MTYASALAREVWIALAAEGEAYQEVASALRASVDRQIGGIVWQVGRLPDLRQREGKPAVVVTVGAQAWRLAQQTFTAHEEAPTLVATLLPAAAFQQTSPPARATALWLDQPPTRLARLTRELLPRAQQASLLLGPESKVRAPALSSALRRSGFGTRAVEVEAARLAERLPEAYKDSDVLLALPDPGAINGQTLPLILAASYRWLVPVIGYSPAMVSAGALAGLYASPSQLGQASAVAVVAALQGRPLPPPGAGPEFTVGINQNVARSLGLVLDAEAVSARLREIEAADERRGER